MEGFYIMGLDGERYPIGSHVTIYHKALGRISGVIVDIEPKIVHLRPDNDCSLVLKLLRDMIDHVEGATNTEDNMVDHPPHYKSETGLEAIDVIEAFTSDLTGIEAVATGNILKYICRWKHKNGLQDLKKAKWYLERLIAHVEKLKKEKEPK